MSEAVVSFADKTWLRPLSRGAKDTSHPIIFCFPYGGGSAYAFQGLAAALQDSFDIWALKMPGRDERSLEAAPTNIHAVVQGVAYELAERKTPFLFYGHSLGAGVALEVANELDRLGAAMPKKLVLSGRMPPHRKYSSLLVDMPDTALWDYIRSESPVALPSDYTSPFADMALKRVRADLALNAQLPYNFEKKIPVSIDTINGREDPLVDLAYTQEWEQYTTQSFKNHILPGGHFFFRTHQERFYALFREILEVAP